MHIANNILNKCFGDKRIISVDKLNMMTYLIINEYATLTKKNLTSEYVIATPLIPRLQSIYAKWGCFHPERGIFRFGRDAAGNTHMIDVNEDNALCCALEKVYSATINHSDIHLASIITCTNSAWDKARMTQKSVDNVVPLEYMSSDTTYWDMLYH